jgi:hypothetical protein
MLMWIEYGIPTEGDKAEILSTKGRSYQQIVRMLPDPIVINPADIQSSQTFFRCKITIGKSDGQQEEHRFEFSVEKDTTI